MRNRAGNFPVGRLMEFLIALGQDVAITVKPTRKARGGMEGGGAVRATRLLSVCGRGVHLGLSHRGVDTVVTNGPFDHFE